MTRRTSLTSRKMLSALAIALLPGLFAISSPVARAGTRLEEKRPLAPGGQFEIDSDAGSVTITGTPVAGGSAAEARILVTSKSDDINTRFDIKVEASGGLVKVTCRKKQSDWNPMNWLHSSSLHFDVRVPVETAVKVDTGGGSIEISHLGKDALLETSGGSISVEDLDAGLTAHTSGGSLSFARVSGDIIGETSGGSIDVEDAAGRVDLETSGGSVSVVLAAGNAKGGRVESSGGSIDVEVDPAAKLNIDASTSGGGASSDLPLARSHVSRTHVAGTLNGGGAPLEVHTSGGSVAVSARGAGD